MHMSKHCKHHSFHPRPVTLTLAAGLFLTSLSPLLMGAGNPVPTSGLFYVSPSGNDAANGDISAPLATLQKAKDLAVAWIHQTDGSGNFINNQADIYLRAGNYPLVAPAANPLAPGLEFTPADTRQGATITFHNNPTETAVIHGALEFVAANGADTGTWSPVTMSVYDGGTTATSLPAAMKSVTMQKYLFSGALRTELQTRITNLRAAAVNGGRACFTELYINDTRKTRARTPNARSLFADTSKFTVTTKPANPDDFSRLSLAQPIVRIDSRWVEMVQGGSGTDYGPVLDGKTELVFTRAWQWGRGFISPDSTFETVDTFARLDAKIIGMENPCTGSIDDISHYTYPEGQLADFASATSIDIAAGTHEETWNRGHLENNKLFVDQPGEWYFDDDEIALYYYPASGESVTTEKFQIPVTYRLIALSGTETDNGDGTFTENFVRGVQFIGEGTGNFSTTSNYELQFQKSAWKYENNRGNSEFYSARHGNYVQTGAIDGNHVDGLTVAYCKFTQFGGTAIALGGNRLWANGQDDRLNYSHQPRGSVMHILLQDNYITDGGGSGIRVDHYPRRDGTTLRYPAEGNTIMSNNVTFIGKNFADGIGIQIPHAIDSVVTGNSVDDIPFVGIKAGYGCYRDNNDPANERVEVRANGIVRAMRMLMDGGGIYTGGGRRMIIANNTLVNTGTTRDFDANIASSNARLIDDLYLDLSSQLFTVSSNSVSEIFSSRKNSHTFSGNTGSIFYKDKLDATDCASISDTQAGCCADLP